MPPVYNVPYRTSLAKSFEVGTVLRIRGLVPEDAKRFYINLLCSDDPDSDIVLHFNPRLDESSVVMNTWKCGEWGLEELGFGPSFQRGESFDMLIIAEEKGFQVVIGDEEYHQFSYRLPPQRALWMEVGGDVQLEFVKLF
ncbi:galectin-7-like [Sagmatias obliquidens]|uniref:galectin-7-like n=1 Tax=Sagmatias obliquidens TaxID=3371155 RepID=UPI000F44135F|nr:galectin-7-like [Lagenorhynchus obliquidens]